MPWSEIGCYALVCAIAALLVGAEVLKAFGAHFFPSLRMRWTWLLVAINMVVAGITYGLARLFLKVESGLTTALIVGVLYPLLLRSKFTFFRQVGAKEDPKLDALSLRMDELYTTLQARCYREVDTALALARRTRALNLTAQMSEAQLVETLRQVIAARQIAAAREEDEHYLIELQKLPEGEERKYRLAMLLVDIAGDKLERLSGSP